MYDGCDVDIKMIRIVENIQIFLSTVSLLLTGSVIFILCYKYKELVTGRNFLHWVLVIAISDFISSFGYSFGYPTNKFLCPLQGFLIVIFARFSWFYTVVLIIQAHHVTLYATFLMKKRYFHLIVITLNFILFIIPFTNGCYYGTRGTCEKGFQICTIGEGHGHGAKAERWIDILFFPFLILSFLIIFVLTINMMVRSCTKQTIPHFLEAYRTIVLYSVGMFIAWVPQVCYNLYMDYWSDENNGYSPSNIQNILNVLISINTLYGPILSIIFWVKVDMARKLLYELVFNVTKSNDLRTTLIETSNRISSSTTSTN